MRGGIFGAALRVLGSEAPRFVGAPLLELLLVLLPALSLGRLLDLVDLVGQAEQDSAGGDPHDRKEYAAREAKEGAAHPGGGKGSFSN